LQLVGIALLVRYLRRRNRKDGRKALNEAEKERVDAL
jgi:cytochrome c-type biogenesis protein CcmH/NrfF